MDTLYRLSETVNGYAWNNLTQEQVVHTIYTDDSACVEMRPHEDGEGWELWHRTLNGRWGRVGFSLKDSEAAAYAEIMKDIFDANQFEDVWSIETMDEWRNFLDTDERAIRQHGGDDMERELAVIAKWRSELAVHGSV